MSSSAPESQTSPDKKAGGMAAFKGFLIFLLLLVGAGAGGYFFGTYQKFAPLQYVAPGTPGAVSESATASQPASSTAVPAASSGQLKNKYWISSSGYERVGYSISVFVNGQLVDKIFTPDKKVEITRLVRPGENSIRFEAKCLPPSMNEHRGSDYYHLTLGVQSGSYLEDPKANTLLNYKRNSAETQDYDDTLSFVTLE